MLCNGSAATPAACIPRTGSSINPLASMALTRSLVLTSILPSLVLIAISQIQAADT